MLKKLLTMFIIIGLVFSTDYTEQEKRDLSQEAMMKMAGEIFKVAMKAKREFQSNQLREELIEKNQQISKLNDKVKLLQVARSVGGESTKEVKLKINEMVREIDKCIAQINR